MARVVLTGLTKRFGSAAAVDDVTLALEQGALTVLLGPSGCGKTTTLRMIGGFVAPTAGSIRIGERDVTREPPWRRHIGFVFQNYALFPHLTVFENVAFGLRRRRVREPDLTRRVNAALALVRLDAFAQRRPRAMSGGQQQRVAIARAIAIEPDVLLLDEPLSNLDAQLRHDVRAELAALQSRLGQTTVMVTHDQDEAMSLGHSIVVMREGRVRQVGAPTEIYRRPADRFVAAFVGRGNFLDGVTEPGGFMTAGGVRIACDGLDPATRVLLVRPEAVRLRPPAGGLTAVVEAAVFVGAVHEVVLRLPGGERLQALGHGDPRVGQEFDIEIDRTAPVGLPPEAGHQTEQERAA
jgi:putative spermidine/putrescine transport system ATP-binding protein